ncbi:hypothetical protein COCNU_09G007570 [Cocos nucifera]|uniref:Uncharacterized protein n=1 Tax=Cocos nucifera TaxID=13894 RepID=A0A8K0N7L6_COCNU|nr:hypothetical protein COCNU_09G007570 [Cocos nucifera]
MILKVVEMDVYISEEYVIRRRREREMRKSTAGAGKCRESGGEEERAHKKWTDWMGGLVKERRGVRDDGGENGSEEVVFFGCFSP